MSHDLDLRPFHLKTVNPLTRPLENVYANFDFSKLFWFRVRSPYGTDRRTGKTRKAPFIATQLRHRSTQLNSTQLDVELS